MDLLTPVAGLYLQNDANPTTVSILNNMPGLVDGNQSSSVVSEWDNNEAFGIDLGATVDVEKLVVFTACSGTAYGWRSSYPSILSFFKSNDNITWALICANGCNNAALPMEGDPLSGQFVFSKTFDDVQTARYFKIVRIHENTPRITKAADLNPNSHSAISLAEIQAFGTASDDPPAEDPPADDPPAEDPPAEDPPADDPPVSELYASLMSAGLIAKGGEIIMDARIFPAHFIGGLGFLTTWWGAYATANKDRSAVWFVYKHPDGAITAQYETDGNFTELCITRVNTLMKAYVQSGFVAS